MGKRQPSQHLAAASVALQVMQDLKVRQVGANRRCSRHQVTLYCGSGRSELPETRSLLGPAMKRQTEASGSEQTVWAACRELLEAEGVGESDAFSLGNWSTVKGTKGTLARLQRQASRCKHSGLSLLWEKIDTGGGNTHQGTATVVQRLGRTLALHTAIPDCVPQHSLV